MATKRLEQKMVLKRGTTLEDSNHLKQIIDHHIVIYAKSQAIYNDGTQSVNVEIHFKPFNSKK